KVGAVPVPTNTRLKPRDYEYMLNDSRAVVAIVSDDLAPAVEEIRPRLRHLTHLVVAGQAGPGQLALGDLLAGEPDTLMPAEPAKVFETITRERPTLFFAVPTAYAALLQVPDAERVYDLGSVRVCLSAGEPLPKAIYERWLQRFGLEILDGIGTTEMCHTFIANRRGRVRPGSSGTLVPGYDAKIVDDEGREVATGEVGNL